MACTALMIETMFKLPLGTLVGLINSLFLLMNVDLQSPDYSCIRKPTKTVNVSYR
ncbi:transposase [Agarivorans sp. Z349TD_8]|uniref:transposase n=1 Tax=Agarivorans sp. Z349TD_8 TaxID=3421434 RepID=UPI003F6ADC14